MPQEQDWRERFRKEFLEGKAEMFRTLVPVVWASRDSVESFIERERELAREEALESIREHRLNNPPKYPKWIREPAPAPQWEREWRIGFENEFAGWWGNKSLLTERIEDYIESLLSSSKREIRGKIEERKEIVKGIYDQQMEERVHRLEELDTIAALLSEND